MTKYTPDQTLHKLRQGGRDQRNPFVFDALHSQRPRAVYLLADGQTPARIDPEFYIATKQVRFDSKKLRWYTDITPD